MRITCRHYYTCVYTQCLEQRRTTVVETESQRNISTCVRARARACSVELVIPWRVIWKGEGTTKIEDGNTVDDDNVGGWQELYKSDTVTKGGGI